MSVIEFKLNKPVPEVIEACETLLELAKAGEIKTFVGVYLVEGGKGCRIEAAITPDRAPELCYELSASKQKIIEYAEDSRGYYEPDEDYEPE